MEKCEICPRRCGADRSKSTGRCGAGEDFIIARAAMHYWEEPCISGCDEKRGGSGAIFFSGCPLGCVFCQNHQISFRQTGMRVTSDDLAQIMLRLRDEGAYNINLVSPTQYTLGLAETLGKVKDKLGIPVVWNTGGYERIETLKLLDGLVDIWLPDLKYFSGELSERYANAPDYFEYASRAVKYMVECAGKPVFSDDGMLKSGVIVRHMVIPSRRADSIAIIKWLCENFRRDELLVSLLSQYTPNGVSDYEKYPELRRKITTFEYQSVIKMAHDAGFDGYTQQKSSATAAYLPDFDLGDVK